MAETSPSTVVCLEEDFQSGSRFANQKRCFGSSFQPIFTLLKCFGVDVPWGEQRVKHDQNLSCFAVWSFINTAVIIIYTKRRIEESLEDKEVSNRITDLIEIVHVWLQILGIYFACVLATYQHGRRLAEVFERLEIHFQSGHRLHKRIRRASFITVATILMMVTWN